MEAKFKASEAKRAEALPRDGTQTTPGPAEVAEVPHQGRQGGETGILLLKQGCPSEVGLALYVTVHVTLRTCSPGVTQMC